MATGLPTRAGVAGNVNGLATANVWNTVLGYFYPEVCQLCREEPAGPAQGYVGDQCRAGLRWIQAPYCERCGLPFDGDITGTFECSNCRELELHFQSARAAVVASPAMLEVIHRYKYQRQLWFEPFLADLLIHAAKPVLMPKDWDFIVPVPLHPQKEREREFNQAQRLARRLSLAAGIPLADKLLKRISATTTQTHLTRAARATNMRNAFAVRPGSAVGHRRLVLVDDVFTTGATTSDCARALTGAGAAQVCVWTVARGI